MDKQRLEEMMLRLQLAVNEIARGEGVEIKLSEPDYLFGENNTYKVSMTIADVDPVKQREYEAMCKKVGFTQNVIGMSFTTSHGSLYRIVNIKTRNRKYPVIASSRLGGLYKFSAETVKRQLGGDQLINRNANLDKLIP
jgi:hypothetical protein